MPAFFPDRRPADLDDVTTLRWSLRWADGGGFLFFCNRQPDPLLADHAAVQFALKTAAGTRLIPGRPIAIPSGCFGCWPVDLDCAGVRVAYATAQLICRIEDDRTTTLVLSALPGIVPELVLDRDGETQAPQVVPGTEPTRTVAVADGRRVAFVVLTSEQGRRLWRVRFAGRDRAVLSHATVLADGDGIRLQASDVGDLAFSVFPPVAGIEVAGVRIAGQTDGVFARFAPPVGQPATFQIEVLQERAAGPKATTLMGTEESTWDDAAVYRLAIPAEAAGRRVVLDVRYIGDAARLVLGDRLLNDDYFDGDPFPIALWRIPVGEWPALRLKVLPYCDALADRLPGDARRQVAEARNQSSVDRVTIDATETVEVRVRP